MNTGGFLFLAFGPYVDPLIIAKLDPECESMGIARVEGHRLAFTPEGWSNLKPEPGSTVWGVMWLVPAGRMAELDAWARSRGFKRGVTFVVSPAGPRVPATAYFDLEASEGKPDAGELQKCVMGAGRSRLPKEYLAQLESWMKM